MFRIVTIALSSALLLGSSLGAAQSSVGRPGGPNGGSPRSETTRSHAPFAAEFDTRRLLGDPSAAATVHQRAAMVASCLARRGGDHASRFVGGGLTDDPEFRELNKALARRYRDCDKQDAGIPPMLVSGGLAEVILQQSGGIFDDRAKSVDVDRAAKFYGGLDGEVSMDSIAGCDAVYSPGLVQKVLAAPSAGKDEEAALTALYKNTPECGLVAPPPGIPMIYQRAALAAALLLWSQEMDSAPAAE